MRLMGKRQLSELQPFEFVITLILADLACVPMAEIPIPLTYGLIPIFSIFMLHILISLLSVKSIKMRKLLNGTPQIIINNGSLCFSNIKKLGMHTNDILEGLRNKGFFSPLDVEFAIVETNGKLSVLPKSHSRPTTPKDMNISLPAPSLPVSLITEGKFLRDNLISYGADENKIKAFLKKQRLNLKDIMLFTIDGEKTVYIQPYHESFRTMTVSPEEL
jgi:uncharacterized membrane protein YcaP (DUF421 family)